MRISTRSPCLVKDKWWCCRPGRITSSYGIWPLTPPPISPSTSKPPKLTRAKSSSSLRHSWSVFRKTDDIITTHLSYLISDIPSLRTKSHSDNSTMMRSGPISISSGRPTIIPWCVGSRAGMTMASSSGRTIYATRSRANLTSTSSPMTLVNFYPTIPKPRLPSRQCGRWLHWSSC